MAFGWVFATRVGTQWQQSGLTVLRRPDVRPTFVGDEVGALPLEQDAQQDDLAAQATAFLEMDTTVSDGRGPGTETTPGAAEPGRTTQREKRRCGAEGSSRVADTPPSTRGHAGRPSGRGASWGSGRQSSKLPRIKLSKG